jgi:hypothetical protein
MNNPQTAPTPSPASSSVPDLASKPIWIPLVGYLVCASGLHSLGMMVASWTMQYPAWNLGVIGIWMGAGMVQYHWRSARTFAAVCFLMALFIGLLARLTGADFTLRNTVGLMGVEKMLPYSVNKVAVAAIFFGLLFLGGLILSAKPHFNNRNAKFHPRDIPRHSVPVAALLVLLATSSTLGEYRWIREEQLLQNIQAWTVHVQAFDAETGEDITALTSFGAEALPNGGICRRQQLGRMLIGETWRVGYSATPPLRGAVNLFAEGYQSVREYFTDSYADGGSKLIKVEMRRLRPGEEAMTRWDLFSEGTQENFTNP